jgi:hypothetical protein
MVAALPAEAAGLAKEATVLVMIHNNMADISTSTTITCPTHHQRLSATMEMARADSVATMEGVVVMVAVLVMIVDQMGTKPSIALRGKHHCFPPSGVVLYI